MSKKKIELEIAIQKVELKLPYVDFCLNSMLPVLNQDLKIKLFNL